MEIGYQVELEALHSPRQRNAANRQDQHQEQQTDHHRLGDALHAFLQPQGADPKSQEGDDQHPSDHRPRLGQHCLLYTS